MWFRAPGSSPFAWALAAAATVSLGAALGEPTTGDTLRAAVNARRAERGRAPLEASSELDRYAQERAEAAARSGRLVLDTASQQLESLAAMGYAAHLVSAILAQAPGDAEAVVRGWRNDPRGTFEETLKSEFRDLGVGVARSPDRRQAPVYVLVLGLSWADYFTEGTAGLADRAAVRRELVSRVNEERARHRIQPLRSQPRLDRVAQDYAERMLREEFYDHVDPQGTSVLHRTQAIGYGLTMVGENLASGQFTAEQVFEGWLSSPEHRKNLLDREFREVGHGVAYGHNAAGWQVLWVQVFATPR